MRALLLALLILPALAPAARAQEDDDEDTPLQRYLVHVQLGDGLERVRRVYPPAQEWPATIEPRTGVTRYKVERGNAKEFPPKVETLYLGFKKGRPGRDRGGLRREAVPRPHRRESGGGVRARLRRGAANRRPLLLVGRRTVLRVFPAEIPITKDGEHAVSWRTAVQVFDKGLFKAD